MASKTGPDAAKSTPSTAMAVYAILALKCTFPFSFDTMGDMPSTYTIHTDPSIPPVQCTQLKVPIEYYNQIEKILDKVVALSVISPVTQCDWVDIFPHLPQEAGWYLHICLNPQDLNKEVIWEHYKALAL